MWDKIKELKGSLWRQVQRRSPYNHSHTQQIVTVLREAVGEVSEEMRRIVQDQFSEIAHTEPIGDSIREGRLDEVGPSSVCSRMSAFTRP